MWEHFEHVADIGIRGIGDTLEQAFAEGARAMFAVMVDISKVQPKEQIEVKVTGRNLPELFASWLNELLAQKDITGLTFSEFEVQIKQTESGYELVGKARGEPLDPERHRAEIEVKAATYEQLKVEQKNGKWIAQCVVDV